MKTLMTIILLVNMLGLSFGRGTIPDVLYWALIPLAFVLIVCYWFASFWVSHRDVVKTTGSEPDFEIFAGKVSLNPSDDLLRGRLCVTGGRLVLYVRCTGRERRNARCSEKWSVRTADIVKLGFGKLGNLQRRGLYVYTESDVVMFTCESVSKRKKELYSALGWNCSGC